MRLERTMDRFGFHLAGGLDEPRPTSTYVQIYVKSSTLSRAADLAISTHLTTTEEIDQFVDAAVRSLEEVRAGAKEALATSVPNPKSP